MNLRVLLLVLLVAALSTAGPRPLAPTQAAAAVPVGWQTTFQLGMMDPPGDAAGILATAPFALRSQYLAGGVNTGTGWSTWNPNGTFVSLYADESENSGMKSVFDYYMLLQSNPSTGADEGARNYSNLNNTSTMSTYYADLKLFFTRAAGFPAGSVTLQFEPDLWGFLQQRSSGDDARSVSASVASSGFADVAGLPNTAAGFAQAARHLRDLYAPGVLLAYHVSIWGTGNDILYSDPSDPTVDGLAARAVNFYSSLGVNFDLTFQDPSDRDAAFKQHEYGDGGAAWWSAGDYARHVRFLSRFAAGTGKPNVLWQTPLGNTKMRAMNNTWGHYQDNHVEWLLDDATRAHLTEYANAGTIAVIFGGGAAGTTCACDAIGDGVTNPSPINGNTLASLSADDDGGFFRSKAAAYYAAGALPLPGSVPPAAATPPPPTAPPPGSCTSSTGPGIPPPASPTSGTPGLHASWYGQSGYPTLCPGDRSTATVAFLNSGSVGWVRGRMGEVAYLGTWSPQPGQDMPSPVGGDGQFGSPNTAWPRYNRLAIQPAEYVGPGQVAWFQFQIQAPTQSGTYRLYLRPLVEGAQWLEDYGVFWVVTVR